MHFSLQAVTRNWGTSASSTDITILIFYRGININIVLCCLKQPLLSASKCLISISSVFKGIWRLIRFNIPQLFSYHYLVDSTSKRSIFFGIQEHLALERSLFCKSFCKASLSSLVTQEAFERCEWVIHLWAEVKRMLSHAHAQTHTHTHSLWEASLGRRQGAEGWLEPYEQPAGIFSFHSNDIIHTTICFSCVKKCFYGIRIDQIENCFALRATVCMGKHTQMLLNTQTLAWLVNSDVLTGWVVKQETELICILSNQDACDYNSKNKIQCH